MQITSYNPHLGLLDPSTVGMNTEQFTRHVARPTSL